MMLSLNLRSFSTIAKLKYLTIAIPLENYQVQFQFERYLAQNDEVRSTEWGIKCGPDVDRMWTERGPDVDRKWTGCGPAWTEKGRNI